MMQVVLLLKNTL